MTESAALTRWLTGLARVAATTWPIAPCSFGALLARRRAAGRGAATARR